MDTMPQKNLDLASVFQSVTQSLAENQQALDQADEYNGDHGSNMVQTFQTISNALEKKKGSSTSTALNYAAQQLSKNTSSGSGKLYAENLAQAASQFKGKQIDSQGALQLLQTLIGGRQSGQLDNQSTAQAGGDSWGELLGGLMGGGQPAAQSPSLSGGGDMLSTLLGGLLGGGQPAAQSPSQSGGGDLLSTLLNGFVSSGGLQSLVQAFLGNNGMGDASHRTQSTQLVVNAFLQALMSSTGGQQ
jgi:hypothetical protein